jgi:hypothetical protein
MIAATPRREARRVEAAKYARWRLRDQQRQIEQLSRDLALAESRIGQLERRLVAAGGDPESV